MDLVSVIVPVYNVEQYLDRCIHSIVHQTYRNLEILLIDDGSSDRSSGICDQWANKDHRIRVFHRKNSGLSAARNIGLDKAVGNLIMMVDSDDYLSHDIVSVLYTALTETEADLAVCDFVKGADESFCFIKNESAEREIIDNIGALEKIYKDSNNAIKYIAAWGKLYRKKLFEGIRYPEGKIFEDIYTTHKLLYRCKRITLVPQKLIYYYQRQDSIMNSEYNTSKLDYLEALRQRKLFFHQHNLQCLEKYAYEEYLHALIWEYSRARDLLNDCIATDDIKRRFRSAYVKGYSSRRYPHENAVYLAVFNTNPEWIILYWKLSAKWRRLIKKV